MEVIIVKTPPLIDLKGIGKLCIEGAAAQKAGHTQSKGNKYGKGTQPPSVPNEFKSESR